MPKKEPRAGCILVNSKGKLLIVHNKHSDFWGFPKGGKRSYETHLQAALRELREEAGVRLNSNLIITSFSSNKSRLYLAFIELTPRCRVDMRECDAYQWVSLDELRRLKTSKFTQSFFGRLETFLYVRSKN